MKHAKGKNNFGTKTPGRTRGKKREKGDGKMKNHLLAS
jgi:hypothetical protein